MATPVPPLVLHVAEAFCDTPRTGLRPIEVDISRDSSLPEFLGIEKQQCFRNAAMLVLSGFAKAYALGVIWAEDLHLPIEHAWVVMHDGTHMDPTFSRHPPGSTFRYMLVVTAEESELSELMCQPPRHYPPQMHHLIRARHAAA